MKTTPPNGPRFAAVCKNLTLIAMLVAVGFSQSTPQASAQSTATGPVGQWRFDEGSGTTAFDSSGTHRDGSIVGATWISGHSGTALEFDGTGDYVQVDDPGLPTEDFTYMAWVKPTLGEDLHAFMASDGSGGNELIFKLTADHKIGLWLDRSKHDGSAGTTTAVSGQWNHIAVTRAGSTVTTYMNGHLESTLTDGTTLSFGACPLFIGLDVDSGCAGGLGNWADGGIDEARVYDRALSGSDIAAIAASGDPVLGGDGPPSPESVVEGLDPQYLLGEAGLESGLQDDDWHAVSFSNTYSQAPLVFATTQTENGAADPSQAHVRGVTGGGFETQHCEVDLPDSCALHAGETNGWVALVEALVRNEAGMDAGTVQLTDTTGTDVLFNKPFANPPLVFAQVQTEAGPDVPRNVQVTSTTNVGFTIELCEQDSTNGCGSHPTVEEVAWWAIDTGQASPGSAWDWGTVEVADSQWEPVSFSQSYSTPPAVMAMVQTENGGHEALYSEVRDVTTQGASVRYCEYDGTDDCDTHAAETVAWAAVAPGPLYTSWTVPVPDSGAAELQHQACQSLAPDSGGEDLGCQVAPGRLPANWLESFESVQTGTQASAGHDWDSDGIPDVLDAVNLPSEAQDTLATGDILELPQGLEANGFMLLVEPGHEEAYMVVSDATASPVQATTAEAALAWMESAYGVAGRNTLARVLHDGMTVHMQEIQPNTPLAPQSLPFPTGQATDGSWLLLRSDATRSVEILLGGVDAPIAPPLASHATQAATNPRWEFLNLHRDDSFCYDDLIETGASACTGGNDPGWIRAYSGQAAYALESLEAALAMDLVDIGPPSVEGVVGDIGELPGAVEDEVDDTVATVLDEIEENPGSGPVGEWMFDEGSGTTAFDSSGNDKDGSITGATWVSGHAGSALDFDGVDDYVQVDDPGLPTGDFTFMAWVKPTSGEDLHVFMASDGSGGNELIFKLTEDHKIGLWLDRSKHDGSVGTTTAVPGQWNHIAVTRSGSTVTTYMNGDVDGVLMEGAQLSFGSCPLFLGLDVDSGCSGGLGDWADGGIDEARVYDRALSPSKIQAIAGSHDLLTSTSDVAVDGAVDTFTFATGITPLLSPSVSITLTAPDGQSLVFTRVDAVSGNEEPPQVWQLDGTRVSGPDAWVAAGNLDGAPADGTWQWSVEAPTVFYESYDGYAFSGGRPDITLSVGGKTIRAGYNGLAPAFSNPQLWNWHVTPDGATFQDDEPDAIPGVDENVQADEDPRKARYFNENAEGFGGEELFTSMSNIAVDGAVDTFTFATGSIWLGPPSVTITLTAPDGQSMAFTRRVDASGINDNEEPPQVWHLDGTRVSGPDAWVAAGNLDEAPADGTWQWSIEPPLYDSNDGSGFASSRPDITLSVAGKTIRAGYDSLAPAFSNPQLWNWHVTPDGATFQDDEPDLISGVDDNVQADEDPRKARYFNEIIGGLMEEDSTQSSSQSFTFGDAWPSQPGPESTDESTATNGSVPAGDAAAYRVPESDALYDVFDEDSPWQVMGDESRRFAHGVGVDYLFDLDGLDAGQSLVTQARSLENASTPSVLRQFHFQGNLVKISAEPHDLRHVSIGIEAIDGDAGGQAFVLDGRALDALLDFGGHAPVLEVDEDHEEGFVYDVWDVDGDGYDDAVVYVPHFSQSWIRVSSSQACTDPRFWDVEVVSSTSAWLSSNCGKIYEYTVDVNGNGYLEGHTIEAGGRLVSTNQEAYGIHLLGPREFYVAGEGDCHGTSGNSAFIAHYRYGFQSVEWIGSKCDFLYDVWVNPGRTRGFAGGEGPTVDFNGASWQSTTAPGRPAWSCGIMDIEYDDQARGYLAVANPDCQSANPVSSIMHFDGTSFSTRNVEGSPPIFEVIAPDGPWATGIQASSSKPGIYKQSGSTWQQVAAPFANHFWGAAPMPGTDTTWFVGSDSGNDAIIVRHTGAWKSFDIAGTLPATSRLQDVDVVDKRFGLAVGSGTVVRFQGNVPPVAKGSVSPSDVDTQETVTATSSSYDPDNDALTHEWYWGDGGSSTGATATHKYSEPSKSTYPVTLVVTDSFGDSDSKTFNIDVDPESISLGSSDSTTFSSDDKQRHHYKVTSSWGKTVEAKLTSCTADVKLLGRVGAPVPSSASSTYWPSSWSTSGVTSPTLLAGEVSGGYLYLAVEKPSGVSTASCTLNVKQIAKPSTPTIVSLPSLTGTPVTLEATAGHPDGYDTRIQVKWDWRWDSTSLEPPGTTHSTSYSSYEAGTYTVYVRSVDRFGQTGAVVSQSVTVRDRPTVWADGATNIQDAEATLAGRVTDKGGTSSVTARYKVYEGWVDPGQLVASKTYLDFTGWTLPSWTVTGLQAGTLYWYAVEAENDLLSGSDYASFQTDSTTSTLPDLVGEASFAWAGIATEFDLQPDRSESQDVAYHVSWGDGSTDRYPGSGYVSPSNRVSVAHTYALPYGDVVVAVQLETQSGGRSDTVTHGIDVGGSSPLDWVTQTPQAANVVLQAKTASIVEDLSTKARFKYLDGGTWRTSPWYTSLDDYDVFGSWTTPSMSYDQTYGVVVEMQASAGASWNSSPQSVQVNRVPELTVLDAGSSEATYLDDVHFSVLYQDGDGDAPTSIQVDVNGQVLDMHPPAGSGLDHRGGVEYHYVITGDELGAPGTHTPTYGASDGKAYRSASAVQGGKVTVTQAAVATHTFEDDSNGGVPQGFTKSGESLNYWRVADTGAAGMPDYVALGGHGKALWFARSPQGTYNDPDGGVPRGSVSTLEYDLSTVKDPVLSFSSYYETEDLGTSRDRKSVYVNVKDPGDSSWDSKGRLLHEVTGYEGGYKKWRSQAIDLGDYDGKVVQFEFRFDARNNQDNDHVGWLIDDISIGHDEDGDGLPDELERTRKESRISRQLIPQSVEDGGDVKSHVRRPVRTDLDALVMDASISHPDPNDLKVWVGVRAPGSSQGDEILLYDRGTMRNGCPTTLWAAYFGTWNQPSRAAMTEESGVGLTIMADLWMCNLSWKLLDFSEFYDVRDWYIRVQDTANDGQVAVVESLRLTSEGRTRFDEADSDRDTIADGDEITNGWDPIGVDGDGDGIHQFLDAADDRPDVAPPIVVSSNDYTNYTTFVMDNIVTALALTEFTWFDEARQERPLRVAYNGGTWWAVDMPASRPTEIAMAWRDVYGNEGSLHVPMEERSGVYAPVGAEWEIVSHAGKRHSFARELQSSEAMAITAVACPPLAASDLGAPFGDIACGVVALGATVAVGFKFVTTVSEALEKEQVVMSEVAVVTQTNICSSVGGFDSVLSASPKVQDKLRAQGISDLELQDVMQNACPLPVIGDGMIRWKQEVGDLLYVIVTKGVDIVDGWRWELPGVGWSESMTIEKVLAHERAVAQSIETALAYYHANGHCLRSCRFTDGANSFLEVSSTGTGVSGEPQLEVIPMPLEYLKTLNSAFVAFKKVDETFALSITDLTVADMSMGFASSHADRGTGYVDHLHWFWDEGGVYKDCSQSPRPETRRCGSRELDVAFEEYTWFIGPDVMHNVKMEWDGPSGNPLHVDAITGKGVVHKEQTEDKPAGKRVASWLVEKLRDNLAGSTSSFDPDAQVSVAYDFLVQPDNGSGDAAHGEIVIDYQDPS